MRPLLLSFILFSFFSNAQIHLVTNLSNSGPGSLRDMVSGAQINDTVQIDPLLLSGGSDTLMLNSEIPIDKSITILGAIQGPDTIFLMGGAMNRAFNINTLVFLNTVILEDLAFIQFTSSAQGGAIYCNVNDFQLESCVFRDNHALGFINSGGALYISGGNLTITNCRFSNNGYSACSSSTYGTGGAIDAYGVNLTANQCTFYNNTTCQSGGAVNLGGNGHFNHCIFKLNKVLSDMSIAGGGGAVLLNGAHNSSFEGCIFEWNSSEANGGALSITQSYGKIAINNCVFYGNDATQSRGGGIYSFVADSVFVTNSSFSNNTCCQSGFASGGACHFREGFVQLKTSTLYNNTSPSVDLNSANNWDAEIINATIANTSTSGSDLVSVGAQYDLTIGSSIVVNGNMGSSVETNMITNNLGYNIFSNNPSFSQSSDQKNKSFASLGLEPFAHNGGFGKTLLPGLSSIALNAGNPTDFSPAQNSLIFNIRDIGAAERPIVFSDTISACQEYVWYGNTYTQSGIFADTSFNVNSLDSVNILILSLTRIDTGVSVNSGVYNSHENDSGTTYQWVDCDNGYQVISGETDSVFFPGANGNFAVILTKGNCVDTSGCHGYFGFSIIDMNRKEEWPILYPNPTSGNVKAEIRNNEKFTFLLYNLTGKELYRKFVLSGGEIELPKLNEGVYILKWLKEDGRSKSDKLIIRH